MTSKLLIIMATMFLVSSTLSAQDRVRHWDPFSRLGLAGVVGNLPEGATETASESGEVNLQGIWRVGKTPKALISRQVCEEGTAVGDYVVQRIHPDRVIVKSTTSGKIEVLKIYE